MDIQLFKPHSGQAKVIKQFVLPTSQHKYGVLITSRQWGKSLMGMNTMLFWLLSTPNQKGAWVSPIYRQARKVFEEMTESKHPAIKSANKSNLQIEFNNGSTMYFLSAEREDGIRGYSFNYMVIDEAAFISQDSIEKAILPTMTAAGVKCLVISTPKGKNWLYDWYMRGLQDNPSYISFKGQSHDNPKVDQQFIEDCRKSFPPAVFRQEFEASFEDAGNDVFTNIDNVCIANEKTRYNSHNRYYGGIDVGVNNDYTCLTIMDQQGRVVDIYRSNNLTFEQHAANISRMLREYNCGRNTNLETNGVGAGLFELVNKQVRVNKWTTTNDNKAKGIQNLIYDIQEGVVELPSKDWEPSYYNELQTFTYKQTPNGKIQFGARGGFHDDTTMSLMMANEARKAGGLQNKMYIGNASSGVRRGAI